MSFIWSKICFYQIYFISFRSGLRLSSSLHTIPRKIARCTQYWTDLGTEKTKKKKRTVRASQTNLIQFYSLLTKAWLILSQTSLSHLYRSTLRGHRVTQRWSSSFCRGKKIVRGAWDTCVTWWWRYNHHHHHHQPL